MLRAVHLLDDVSLGGVTRALSVFEDPAIAGAMASRIVQVAPDGRLAPRLEADVIFTHFPPRWRALPFLVSLRLRNPRARLVHVEHSYTAAWVGHKVQSPARFALMLRLAYALFHRVVAVSQGQATWLARYVGRPRRLAVIPPWSGATGLDSVAPLRPVQGRPLRLLAYGRFAEQKGFDILLKAMARLPADRYTLTLAGLGPDESALRALTRDLPHVSLIGPVDDLPALLGAADVVVVPSRWEAYGLVAAEARQAGRPVLVAAVDGLPEQAGDPRWIADCRSPETLAAALAAIDPATLAAAAQQQQAAQRRTAGERVSCWLRLIQDLSRAV